MQMFGEKSDEGGCPCCYAFITCFRHSNRYYSFKTQFRRFGKIQKYIWLIYNKIHNCNKYIEANYFSSLILQHRKGIYTQYKQER